MVSPPQAGGAPTVRLAGAENRGGRTTPEAELHRCSITQKNSPPSHRTTQGKIECLWQTLKKWLHTQPVQPTTITELQTLLDTFTEQQDHRRPHRPLPHRAHHRALLTEPLRENGWVEIGEHWGYRARGVEPLVEIEVIRIGTKRPPRALIRFVDDQHEGREQWVPPGRLKVPWEEASEFMASEARWERVDTHPGLNDTPEEYAIEEVFKLLIDGALAEPFYSRPGVTSISDVRGLAAYLEVDEGLLRAAPESFEEEECLIVPWATTEMIVRTACRLHPEPVLHKVDKDEANAQKDATHGRWAHDTRRTLEWFIEPGEAATRDRDFAFGAPCREVLRHWCGNEAVARQDELKALREEVVRLDGLMSEAIREVRSAGLGEKATDLERRFGIPVAEARSSRR